VLEEARGTVLGIAESEDGGLHYRLTFLIPKVFGAGFFCFIVAVEIPYYFGRTGSQPGWVISASVFIAVGGWLAVRASRMATLLADDEKVTVRNIFRTRSWPWHHIDGFVVETRVVGRTFFRRRVLGLRLNDGNVRWFEELNCRPSRGARRSRVDDAAAVLNGHLSGLHKASSDA
jgi:hypothetical protein